MNRQQTNSVGQKPPFFSQQMKELPTTLPQRGPIPQSALQSVFLLLIGGSLIASGGCAANRYRAASLPAQYRTVPQRGGVNLDLTRLAAPIKEDSSAIGPGDVLRVMVVSGYGEVEDNEVYTRVKENGSVTLPLIGDVPLAGLRPDQAESTVTQYYIERGFYKRPHVTVLMEEKSLQKVTVVGAVETPGLVELERTSSDLLGALAAAGGLSEDAGTELQILRKSTPQAVANQKQGDQVQLASHQIGQTSTGVSFERIDLVEASQSGLQNLELGDGDVVVVYREEPRVVYVSGLVNKASAVEIPPRQDMRVLDALAAAEGRRLQLADKVHVIRRVPESGEPIVIQVSVREAKRNGAANLVLAPGDVVSVEETPVTMVFGTIEKVLRFGISGSVPLF